MFARLNGAETNAPYGSQRAMTILKRYAMDESGSGAIEYGLLGAMIACFVISALQKVGLNMNSKFKIISNALS